jgi:hypothetical protein
MKDLNAVGKLNFTKCLRTILYEYCGEAESETYAYYQKHCSFIFKVEPDVVDFSAHYFKLHGAIRSFECLYQTHKDVDLFEIVPKRSGDEVTVLSRAQFFEKRKDFYENEGRRISSKEKPMSILYVSETILDYIYKDIKGSLFTKSFSPNEFTSQLDVIYREIKKKNYPFSDSTTVKEFFRDIIEPVYPKLSLNDQNVFWKFFKPRESLATPCVDNRSLYDFAETPLKH